MENKQKFDRSIVKQEINNLQDEINVKFKEIQKKETDMQKLKTDKSKEEDLLKKYNDDYQDSIQKAMKYMKERNQPQHQIGPAATGGVCGAGSYWLFGFKLAAVWASSAVGAAAIIGYTIGEFYVSYQTKKELDKLQEESNSKNNTVKQQQEKVNQLKNDIDALQTSITEQKSVLSEDKTALAFKQSLLNQ